MTFAMGGVPHAGSWQGGPILLRARTVCFRTGTLGLKSWSSKMSWRDILLLPTPRRILIRSICTKIGFYLVTLVCFWPVLLWSLLLLFSHSVMSDSLWPNGCSMPGFLILHNLPEFAQTHVHWVNESTISSSINRSTSCPQSFPASGSFLMNLLFISGGQSIGALASALVLPMNTQDWFPLGWTDFILQSKRLSRVFSSTRVQKHQFLYAQPSLWSNSHIHTWLL